jgi:hypothetical protein
MYNLASMLRTFLQVSSCAHILILGTGCTSTLPQYDNQLTFKTPEAAVDQLSKAVSSGNSTDLEAIFGSKARQTLSSGDPVADRQSREVISVALNESRSLKPIDSNTRELVIGAESWPFPIPLVKDSRGWWFDTQAGQEEILARRIGRNELSTIQTLRAYAIAQREYAAASRDGKPAGLFAKKIRSDQGRQNGLYWPTELGQPRSPLGEFVASATAEGYTKNENAKTPYHGYYFRVLTSQGSAAPGGAKDYLVNGDLRDGFAMIATPSSYGSSSIMSFLVGPEGIIYESDLGTDTNAQAASITSFNPDDRWKVSN